MKHHMKHVFLILFLLLILVVLYLLFGTILPCTGQPKVSAATKKSFHVSNYYSDGTGPDRARLVDDNQEALDLRLQMIINAKKKIILSTFDFHHDEAGADVMAALLNAADRGVSVEIFVDGFSAQIQMEGNAYFYALSSHPNVTIRVYNPINLFKPYNFMTRMHDKYLIVDNTAYILGGRNTFDYFLGSYEGHKNYDRDVLVYNTGSKDSSLYQVKRYYEKIIALDCCVLFHDRSTLAKEHSVQSAGKELRERFQAILKEQPALSQPYDYQKNTVSTHTIHLISNPIQPTVKEPVAFYKLMKLCEQAKHQVVIHTPYVISNKWMNQNFAQIGSKGIIMFNSTANNGNPFAGADYVKHKKDLISTGMKLHEYEGGISYHAKSITVDDDLSIIGSFNMDMRSTYLDTELMLVIHSEALTKQLNASMNRYDQDALVVKTADTYQSLPKGRTVETVSLPQKCFQLFLGWVLELCRFLL